MPIHIELQNLGGRPVSDPYALVRRHIQKLGRRWFARAPLIKKLTVFIENLNAMVGAVRHKNSMSLRIEDNAVHRVEISWTHVVRGVRSLSQAIKYLPSLSNLTTRVFPYPSVTNIVPSGSQLMKVGRLKCFSSSPATFGVPSVLTTCFPSCVNS